MPCYSPLSGYRGPGRRLVFSKRDAIFPQVIKVGCGQCIGCRLKRSRDWAIRITHEAKLHDANAFITLTYSDANLPVGGTLVKHHFQDFIKRLRKKLSPVKVRYFHCGEYGEKFSRPHYHACIFGFDFPDRLFLKEDRGERYFTSSLLADTWGFGYCVLGDVTFSSAAYVARYCVKKVNGVKAEDHYWSLDERTGECFQVEPEYCTMSRRPGIAAGWFDRFSSDVFPRDEVIVDGFPNQPPRFYDSRYEVLDPNDFERIKRDRVVDARCRKEDQTFERLMVREQVKLAQLSFLKRGYENEL